ncbi:CAP domain-containing protein [Ktedonobacter racemifer]|uniref:SCP-like extracellular n=1 Tax=Ktedonobacter racemifer DSM 44963 TaxID=485913 RepID=D6TDZ8_KTERA|nr:CAP domain-containing protein [Ktedonobacter racemifer]EFH88371.1 SCP-like extracellular [Ktedonobacter racemifer DSM 44963]
MKKRLCILSALAVCIFLVSCGASSGSATTPGEKSTQATPTSTQKQMGTEVAERPLATPTPKKSVQPTPTPQPTQGGANGGNGSGNTGGSSGGGNGGSTPPVSSTDQQLAQQLFALVNQDRASNSLPALVWTPALVVSASRHTQVMAGGCGLSHQCPGESSLGTRETNAGVNWNACGENIGTGGPTPSYNAQWSMASGLHRSMMNETPPNDGHRRNLLSSTFHRIGISIFVDAHNTLWLTEDFAN